MTTSELGRFIIRAREGRGWDRAALARATNIPYTTLRNLEESKTDVQTSEDNLKKMADAIGQNEEERARLFAEMRVLAGYLVVTSQDVADRDRRLLANLASYPQLKKALESILAVGDQEEIDRALTALEVARNMGGKRPK